ncbi:hypothetical protein DFH08DRAFT_285343 [Mycena albidolilacea]|uniref:Uncharacterized protein n=1 Tax=Mycena albidolilacea TaxID=1033008 RepID=A0AAD6ZRV0_9AGAR|nr:hypothetical protein DFH08DRAFT_285343 [Mycena albidolilacea]
MDYSDESLNDFVRHFKFVAAHIGVYQIGVWVSYVLFGVTTMQMYMYYTRFSDDSRKLKGLVALVWVCELGHALCVGHALYVYTIADYQEGWIWFPWSLRVSCIIAGFIVACVQGFFSFRIYGLSKRLYIPVAI